MDRTKTISCKKAGLFTCLFLWANFQIFGQPNSHWLADENLLRAYNQCLSLQLNECRLTLGSQNQPEAIYIASLADALELLITEDKSLFTAYEQRYESRIEALKKISPATEKSLFSLAEIRLQWAFVYLKFGHDFTAAWNVRQAHITTSTCLKKFPHSIPILKTSGILEVLLGSVPEKYQWVLNLLGMNGSVELGLFQLKQVEDEEKSLAFEAALLHRLFEGFVLQETDSATEGMEVLHQQHPDNRLILFLGASLAIKNSMSEVAMSMLEKLISQRNGLPIYYSYYLLGEVYLHQGNYQKSIQAYQTFTKNNQGENYVKDAYYKIGICYWLDNQSTKTNEYFELAKTNGKEAAEADKYAARNLTSNVYPNRKLAKARYGIDGGYYLEASRTLRSVKEQELSSAKDMTEFNYRYARLYHKTHELDEAKNFYLKTIELTGTESWYYAPNSCLQLGYIFEAEGNVKDAEKYFLKALSYKKHEYKNSIDAKAKSALQQLNKKEL